MMFTPFGFIKQPGGSSAYGIFLSNSGVDSGVCAVGPNKNTILYTTDITFKVNSIIYTNSDLTTRFNGNNLFYSTYDSLQAPYDIYIAVNRSGVITITGACK